MYKTSHREVSENEDEVAISWFLSKMTEFTEAGVDYLFLLQQLCNAYAKEIIWIFFLVLGVVSLWIWRILRHYEAKRRYRQLVSSRPVFSKSTPSPRLSTPSYFSSVHKGRLAAKETNHADEKTVTRGNESSPSPEVVVRHRYLPRAVWHRHISDTNDEQQQPLTGDRLWDNVEPPATNKTRTLPHQSSTARHRPHSPAAIRTFRSDGPGDGKTRTPSPQPFQSQPPKTHANASPVVVSPWPPEPSTRVISDTNHVQWLSTVFSSTTDSEIRKEAMKDGGQSLYSTYRQSQHKLVNTNALVEKAGIDSRKFDESCPVPRRQTNEFQLEADLNRSFMERVSRELTPEEKILLEEASLAHIASRRSANHGLSKMQDPNLQNSKNKGKLHADTNPLDAGRKRAARHKDQDVTLYSDTQFQKKVYIGDKERDLADTVQAKAQDKLLARYKFQASKLPCIAWEKGSESLTRRLLSNDPESEQLLLKPHLVVEGAAHEIAGPYIVEAHGEGLGIKGNNCILVKTEMHNNSQLCAGEKVSNKVQLHELDATYNSSVMKTITQHEDESLYTEKKQSEFIENKLVSKSSDYGNLTDIPPKDKKSIIIQENEIRGLEFELKENTGIKSPTIEIPRKPVRPDDMEIEMSKAEDMLNSAVDGNIVPDASMRLAKLRKRLQSTLDKMQKQYDGSTVSSLSDSLDSSPGQDWSEMNADKQPMDIQSCLLSMKEDIFELDSTIIKDSYKGSRSDVSLLKSSVSVTDKIAVDVHKNKNELISTTLRDESKTVVKNESSISLSMRRRQRSSTTAKPSESNELMLHAVEHVPRAEFTHHRPYRSDVGTKYADDSTSKKSFEPKKKDRFCPPAERKNQGDECLAILEMRAKKLNENVSDSTELQQNKIQTNANVIEDNYRVNAKTASNVIEDNYRVNAKTASNVIEDNYRVNTKTASNVIEDNYRVNAKTASNVIEDNYRVNAKTAPNVSTRKQAEMSTNTSAALKSPGTSMLHIDRSRIRSTESVVLPTKNVTSTLSESACNDSSLCDNLNILTSLDQYKSGLGEQYSLTDKRNQRMERIRQRCKENRSIIKTGVISGVESDDKKQCEKDQGTGDVQAKVNSAELDISKDKCVTPTKRTGSLHNERKDVKTSNDDQGVSQTEFVQSFKSGSEQLISSRQILRQLKYEEHDWNSSVTKDNRRASTSKLGIVNDSKDGTGDGDSSLSRRSSWGSFADRMSDTSLRKCPPPVPPKTQALSQISTEKLVQSNKSSESIKVSPGLNQVEHSQDLNKRPTTPTQTTDSESQSLSPKSTTSIAAEHHPKYVVPIRLVRGNFNINVKDKGCKTSPPGESCDSKGPPENAEICIETSLTPSKAASIFDPVKMQQKEKEREESERAARQSGVGIISPQFRANIRRFEESARLESTPPPGSESQKSDKHESETDRSESRTTSCIRPRSRSPPPTNRSKFNSSRAIFDKQNDTPPAS